MHHLGHVVQGDAVAAVAVHVGQDRADLLPAVGGGADVGGPRRGPLLPVHQREGPAERRVRQVAFCRIVPVPDVPELVQDRGDLSGQGRAPADPRRSDALVHPERRQVPEVQLPAPGPGDQLGPEQHQQQAERRPRVRQSHVRLRVVDEEDVPDLRRHRPPAEQECAPALQDKGDLQVVVPVHPVLVTLRHVLDHGEGEVGFQVLLPDVDGHASDGRRPPAVSDRADWIDPHASGGLDSRFCHWIDPLWHCRSGRPGRRSRPRDPPFTQE